MFQCPTIIHSIRTRADKSLLIGLLTREVAGQEAATLFDLRDKEIWVAFKEEPLEAKDIQSITEKPRKVVTPSQRLRFILKKYWEENLSAQRAFEGWYLEVMETIINSWREKLQ